MLKVIGISLFGIAWLALVILASVAPTDEQLAEYHKFKESDVTTPQV